MLKTAAVAAALSLAPAAWAQCDCEPFTTLTWPDGAGSGSVMLRNDDSQPRYRVELRPNRREGEIDSVSVVLTRGGQGPNLLSAPGEGLPRADVQAADCGGQPPSGGLHGRERLFALADALIVLRLEACEATPDGEGAAAQVLSLRVAVEIRPLPPGAN